MTKKTKAKKITKPYWEMTAVELAEATREYDKPMDLSDFKPMSGAQRTKFERSKRKPARSIFISRSAKRGGDACQMVVDIDPALASHCAAFATAKHITLAELVARSLKKATTFAG